MARHPRNDNTDPDSGFVSRWSRRKQQARARVQTEVAAPESQETSLAEDPVVEAGPPLPEKTDADMPPVESITDTSDVAEFFSPGVSEQLRKIALRKLFQGAKFNIRDGLDDYDDDFRNFSPLGNIVTADMKHQQELAREREQQALAEKEKLAEEEQLASTDAAVETTEEDAGENEEQATSHQASLDEDASKADTDDAVAVDETRTAEKETQEKETGA